MKLDSNSKIYNQITTMNIDVEHGIVQPIFLVEITNGHDDESYDDMHFSDPISNIIIINDDGGDHKSEYKIEIKGKYQLIMNYILMRLDHDNLSEDNRDDLDTIGDMISKTYHEMIEIIEDYHSESGLAELNLVN